MKLMVDGYVIIWFWLHANQYYEYFSFESRMKANLSILLALAAGNSSQCECLNVERKQNKLKMM